MLSNYHTLYVSRLCSSLALLRDTESWRDSEITTVRLKTSLRSHLHYCLHIPSNQMTSAALPDFDNCTHCDSMWDVAGTVCSVDKPLAAAVFGINVQFMP
jgi:hypothetical protein